MAAVIALVITFGLMAFIFAGLWKVFTKAGEPGWACLVPIYNGVVLLRIAGKPWYWLLLDMIPLLGIYFIIMTMVDLARNFGKGVGFAVGLIFLGFIFLPILGFSDAEYLGPDGTDAPRRRRRRRPDAYEEDQGEDERGYERARRRARGRAQDFDEVEDRPERRRPPPEEMAEEDRPRRPPRQDFEEHAPRSRRAGARPPADDLDEVEEFEEVRPSPPSRRPATVPSSPRAAQDTKLIPCTGCHRTLRVPLSARGKRVQCPGCGTTIVAE